MAASLKTTRSKVTTVLVKYLIASDTNLRLISRCSACRTQTQVDSKSSPKPADLPKIEIPDKIIRSPTAILDALSSTVKHNANQPMYLGIDDPYLMCTSERVKKNYMASLELGRQAARTMMALTPENFSQIWEEPLPEAWRDPFQGYKYTEPSEAALKERIALRKVSDAISVYKDCKIQKKELSQETLENFLDLLAVFNCEDPKATSDIEEYINPSYETYNPEPVTTWKKGNVAEDVFHALPEKTPRAYCSLIRGMAANFDREGAYALYQEAKSLDLPIDVYTYNKLLAISSVDVSSSDDFVQCVQSFLQEMAAKKVTPNVQTFDSVLSSCKKISRWTQTKNFAISLLAEMKACGIEPQLSTYHEILCIFYYFKSKGEKTDDMFKEILDQLVDKDLTVKSPGDLRFFRTAMKVISTFFPDPSLALKLDNLLKKGQNMQALGPSQAKNVYYENLLTILSSMESTEVVMDLYKSVVPYVFFPTSSVFKAIIENIDMHEAQEHLTWLFTDLYWSSQLKDAGLMAQLIRSMSTKQHEPQLQQQFSDMISTLLQQRKDYSQDAFYMDGSIIGDMIKIYLYNKEPQKAWSALQLYRGDSILQVKDPRADSLTMLATQCIETQDLDATKELLELMLNQDSTNVPSLVEKTLEAFPTLSEQEKNYLNGLAQDAKSQKLEESSESDSD